ncbi:replication initiation protein [Ottowia sp. GY511]|uniref:Replication initiation protein n=2 Tax=Ottowia TaxID=219181 RepID=A0ABW4KZX9_9BURK|nr:replication initiation protein [Ottowia sp. GY511]
MSTSSPAPLPDATVGGTELRKPHEMIVMVPRSHRISLTARKIYNVLLQVAQDRLASMESMPAADHMFEAPLAAVIRTAGAKEEGRTTAKRYLREMSTLEVDWESTAPGDGVKWRGFTMLSEVALEQRNGDNWVAWSYPPTIMSALRDPQRWARLELDVLTSLGSYAAIALYEICARYRDNPSGLTSRKPVLWWVDAISPVPAGTERREWRKIKSERVKPAIDEINSETDLEVELIEHRQGRSVVEVQFAVRKKKVPVKRAPEAIDVSTVVRAESLGIREAKLEALIKEFGEPAVRVQLEVLEQRTGNTRLRGVENGYSYLRSLLRNGVLGEADALELPEQGAPEVTQRAAAAAAVAPPASPSDPPWLIERRAVIRKEIEALSDTQRKGLVDAVVQQLQSQGLMTAVLSRRVASGDVLHGMFGAWVVRSYATQMYGPDWDKRQPDDEEGAQDE